MLDSFVYCWTDHKTNKLYVGVHKGFENDGYICSCKPMLKEYASRPEDFTRQILAHGCFEDCFSLESKILQNSNAGSSDDFYNGHNNTGKFFITEHSELTRNKLKSAWDNKKRKMKISHRMKNKNPMKNNEFLSRMLETRKMYHEERKNEIINTMLEVFENIKSNVLYKPKPKYRRNGSHMTDNGVFIEWFCSNYKDLVHKKIKMQKLLEKLNEATK